MSEKLLRRFVDHVEQGQVPSGHDLAKIADAFRQILAGGEARSALGMTRKKGGQPKTWERWYQEDFLPVWEVEKLRQEEGLTVDKAIEVVAARRHMAFDTLSDKRDKYREDVQILL